MLVYGKLLYIFNNWSRLDKTPETFHAFIDAFKVHSLFYKKTFVKFNLLMHNVPKLSDTHWLQDF